MTGDSCRADEHCITCGDVSVEMRVIETGDGTAMCVDGNGERHRVAVDLVEPVTRGDALLVHAGVAIAPLAAQS